MMCQRPQSPFVLLTSGARHAAELDAANKMHLAMSSLPSADVRRTSIVDYVLRRAVDDAGVYL